MLMFFLKKQSVFKFIQLLSQYSIILVIKTYWLLIPKKNRRQCIFKKSCSQYVFEITKKDGFIKGLEAFYFRYKNCRGDFDIFINPITNEIEILLPSKIIVNKNQIAERLIK